MPGDVRESLELAHDLLDQAGVWHCLTYGSLLGAVRDGDVIAWDTDFDLFIRPVDVPAVLRLSGDGMSFVRVTKPGSHLAMGRTTVGWFDPARLAAMADGVKMGDLYYPTLFDDGVMRIYDLGEEVLWTPQSSFCHFFVQETGTASIGGRPYATPRSAERFLESVYGEDWGVPYRCVYQGGEAREGRTNRGDLYRPHLEAERDWCSEQGWDRSAYCGMGLPHWPRPVRGAGPRGPTPGTGRTSGGLWWRDLREVAEHY